MRYFSIAHVIVYSYKEALSKLSELNVSLDEARSTLKIAFDLEGHSTIALSRDGNPIDVLITRIV